MSRSDARLVSLFLLSLGVLVRFGEFSATALILVLFSVAFSLYSFLRPASGEGMPGSARLLLMVALASSALYYNNKFDHRIYLLTFAGIFAAIMVHWLVSGRVTKLVAGGVAAASWLVGIAANLHWGFAPIDVFDLQQSASQALLRGQNPYSPLVASPQTVAPGVTVDIPLHFSYGPILPVLEAPIRIVGDIRVLHVIAALVTAGAVLALARRAGTVNRTACVLMAFPLTIGMVLLSWVDIVSMAGFAAWIVLFRTHPKVATAALAVGLGVKPTTLVTLVPVFFWSAPARRQIITALGLAILLVAPFAAITGVGSFYHDVIGIMFEVFPRYDALTINSYLHAMGFAALPFAVSALVVALTTVLVLRQRPSSYGDLLTGTAIIATVSFLVAKWAFFNYYYIPAVLLLLAIAGDSLAFDAPEALRPPTGISGALRVIQRTMRRFPGARPAGRPSEDAGLGVRAGT